MGHASPLLRRGRGTLGLVLLWALCTSPFGAAATYSNAGGHYSFDYPNSWTTGAATGVDATLVGPASAGFAPNIVVAHGPENGTEDSAAWILDHARAGFEDIKARMNVTEVQPARVFTTGQGRHAGDFVYDWVFANMTLRQRQVLLVSTHYGTTFVLTFTQLASEAANLSDVWASAVDSFTVYGEDVAPPPPAAADPLLAPLLFVASCGAIAMGAGVVVTSRKRAAQARAAQAMLQARAAQAQLARARAPPSAFSRAPPGGFPAAAPAKAPPVPPRPVAPPRAVPVQPPPVKQAAPVPPPPPTTPPTPPPTPPPKPPPTPPPPPAAPQAAPPAPPPRSPPPAPAPMAAQAPKPAEAKKPAMIKCPKCGTKFEGPATRPATVQCPNCGTKGNLK